MTRTVRVLVDEPAVEKEFDYLVPDTLGDQVRVGTMVRVALAGRRLGGWVVAVDVEPVPGVDLRPIAKVSGWGPDAEIVALARWAAHRWAGRPPHFLRTASPSNVVLGLPPSETTAMAPHTSDPLVAEALAGGTRVLRLPPAADRFAVVAQAAALGPTLVVAPSHAEASHLALRLRRAGVPTALLPREWARARAGCGVVIGARAAAWAPCPDLRAVVVLDEHEEVHQEEASPTWHARDVAIHRAEVAGVPCVLLSPCPSLEALEAGPLVAPSRTAERQGWPAVDVVDRRRDDPVQSDLYSTRLVDLVRSGKRVVCVLNRKGRVTLLACKSCSELARCERCGAAVGTDDGGGLRCRRCAATRPSICLSCNGTAFKQRRIGTARAREDLERLAGVPVGEVTGDSDAMPDATVLVGTEAVLRRVETADAVAFLDLDAELLAPRYRAAEEAMALLARAARIVGGKGGGRLLLQTRLPGHEVVQAALLADPGRVADAERERRTALRFPPIAALAEVSGAAAADYVEGLRGRSGIELLGPADGVWLVRAPDHDGLSDALASVARPPGRLRIAVDQLRL